MALSLLSSSILVPEWIVPAYCFVNILECTIGVASVHTDDHALRAEQGPASTSISVWYEDEQSLVESHLWKYISCIHQ